MAQGGHGTDMAGMEVGTSVAGIERPGSLGRPWLVVALLSLLYAISFVDRMIIALLVDPIRTDLGVSDTQIGLLFGLGFALLYTLCGIPIAHLVDRGNRRRILLAGVLLWSGTTLLSAFADNYAMLLVSRAGVAVGEAVLTPTAISMIADLFPRERRSLPTSIYSMVGAVMGSGAFIVGAGAIVLANALGAAYDISVWRLTLAIVAAPGFVAAALFAWLVAEPPRGAHDPAAGSATSLAEAARYTLRHGGLYLAFFCGVGFMLVVAMSLVAWAPTFLVRVHGLSAAQAGVMFGGVAVAGSIVGTLSVSFVIRRLGGGSPERGVIRAAMLYALIAAPTLAVAIHAGTVAVVLGGIAVAMLGLSASAVLGPLLVQLTTPSDMRARMAALYLLLSGLLSLGIGPLLVSFFAEHQWFGGGLAHALGATSLLALGAALACYFIAERNVARFGSSSRC